MKSNLWDLWFLFLTGVVIGLVIGVVLGFVMDPG